MNVRDQVIDLINLSSEDYFLSKTEKAELKKAIIELAPDRNVSDFLRSQLFRIARERITAENFHQILDWTEKVNKLLLDTKQLEAHNERVYFSPGDTCLNAIISQIKQAKSKIYICLFTISDNRISDVLIEKFKQGLDIRIISDNDKLFDDGSDIETLSNAGIPVRLDVTQNHMHHKFALFDEQITVTGSYNWTRSAAMYNHENILVTNSTNVLREFTKMFNKLWQEFPEFNR